MQLHTYKSFLQKEWGMEPKQKKKNTQLWMGLVIEARSNAVKSNIA